MGWNSGASCSRAASAGWLDILIHVEQIARIIGCFDLCQPGIVVTVGCLHRVGALIHHHVDIAATRRIGVQRHPIVPGPLDHALVVGRVGVDPKDHLCEVGIEAFASARQGISLLSESIKDPILREHFEQAAYAMLPKEKPVSPRRAAADEYDGLSEREREVAALIGQGKSNAEMADLLVVSKRTVETYVSRVLSKLGLTSRSQIALWTRDKGLTSREL